MADDEGVAGEPSADESFAPGPRRSTFTPPVSHTARDEVAEPQVAQPETVQPETVQSSEAYDDDDLANALASQIPGPPRSAAISRESSAPSPVAPSPSAAQSSSDVPEGSAPPAVSSAEQPNPEALPPAPRRRSLADADLLRTIESADTPGGTLSAMEQLEAQLHLREQEAREFIDWKQRMLAIGTPEALRSLDEAIPVFTGVVDIVPPALTAAQAPEPQAPEPQPPVAETFDTPADPSRRRSRRAAPEPVAPAAESERDPQPESERDPEPENTIDEALPAPLAPVVYDLVEPIHPLDPVVGPSDLFFPEVFPPETAQSAASTKFDFDAVLGAPIDTPRTPTQSVPITLEATESGSSPVFIEPSSPLEPEFALPDAASRPTLSPEYDPEPDDQVDDTDRAFEDLLGVFSVAPESRTGFPLATGSAPIQPLSSLLLPTTELDLEDDEPTRLRSFAVEAAGPEPTALDHRVGRAARMFWLWFATNSSVLSVAFGGALFSLGMSLRQAVVAVFVGVAISFLPLGLGTLAGKWSGQPTMIASRATFGIAGNAIPSIVAIVSKVFWGAVLLWLIAVSTSHILVGARLNGPLSEVQLTVVTMAAAFIVALIVAVFGYGLFARLQLVLGILSIALVIGLVVITWPQVRISIALSVGDGPWILVVTGVVLVFSFVGLIWVNSGGDLARYQRPSSSGAAAMLWAPLGATLPAFVVIAYGALLAASNPAVAKGLTTNPLDTIALMIPTWYPVPLIAATVLSLLSGVVLSIYSGGFAVQALGLRIPRAWSSVIIGVLVFALAIMLSFTVVSVVPVFRDLATTLSVPVAAWAGIFSAEMIIRRRRFDSDSLLYRGGVYPTINWVNLLMLFVASAIGYGFTTATISWLTWQGYLFSMLGIKLNSDLAGTDIGVIGALVFGLLITFIVGVPAIRKQERALGVVS